jgi:N-terminal domain of toast_rack, DUF2154/LiaI-LiaF-like transmembrane region
MAQNNPPRRSSLVIPILLIAVGGLILYSNWRPSFDPWPILWTYWPLILIFIGAGKIYDSWKRGKNPENASSGSSAGASVGAIVFVIVLLVIMGSGKRVNRWRGGTVYAMQHQSRTVDRGEAKTVRATLDMGAGDINLSGGSSHLLEADFDYRSSSGTPKVDYSISGTTGELRISQDDESQIRTSSDNHWTLHLANDIPMEIKIDMGAGHGNLRLRDIAVTRLNLDMGAGQVDVDLTGDRKSDLTADIEGGVGEANIRLPKNVGVIVHASGGLGTIDAHGLKHDGDEYTNELYGKSPVTIRLKVEGGVGRIVLTEEP